MNPIKYVTVSFSNLTQLKFNKKILPEVEIDNKSDDLTQEELESKQNDPAYIVCPCGRIVHKSERFHVYKGNFCSMKCLIPYRDAEHLKKAPKCEENNFRRFSSGGTACF